jgi:hypothetical protein
MHILPRGCNSQGLQSQLSVMLEAEKANDTPSVA